VISVHFGVLDPPALAGAEIISKPEDYVLARLAIRDALRTESDLDVFVLTPVCDRWFWDLEGYPQVRLLQDDPITLLSRKLHVPQLPLEIADSNVITALKLLDIPDPAEPIADVLAWVAGQKMDEVWAATQTSYRHITRLLAWMALNSIPSVLEPVAQRRLKLWVEQSRGTIAEVYRSIQNDAEKSILFLCCWQALRAYDEDTLVRWLKEEGWYIHNLREAVDNLGELPLPQVAQEKISSKARAYWRRRLEKLDQEIAS
jgi:hypothetical protein